MAPQEAARRRDDENQADVGIAVAGATDAARAASDLALTEQGLGVPSGQMGHAAGAHRCGGAQRYALVSFLLIDSVKVLTYRIIGRSRQAEGSPS